MTGVYYARTRPPKRQPIQGYTRQRDDDEGDENESEQDKHDDDHAENVNGDSHNNKDDRKLNGYNEASGNDGNHNNKDDRKLNGHYNDAQNSDESDGWHQHVDFTERDQAIRAHLLGGLRDGLGASSGQGRSAKRSPHEKNKKVCIYNLGNST